MALVDNVEAIYHFNGNANDSSGNGLTLTAGGGAGYDTSNQKLGSACASFDGVDDHFRRTLPASFKSANVTYLAWVKLDTLGSYTFMSGAPKGTEREGLGMSINITAGGLPYATIGILGGGGSKSVVSTTSIGTTDLHLVIGTYDGSDLRIFLDGVYEAILAEATGIDWVDNGDGPNPAQFYVGGMRGDVSGTATNIRETDGLVDEGNVFSRAVNYGGVSVGQIAGGEIAQLWNGGAGIELGVGGNAQYMGANF